nr:oplophorus-luciferin 2-monooxygenase non-catalytic subunit-like [Cherax quadricarinatus]
MVYTTLLVVAATLLAGAASDMYSAPSPLGATYCPEPADIYPCVCKEQDIHIDMDCSEIQDNDQLQRIFHSSIPFDTYRDFIIMKNTTEERVQISYLTKETFANVSFSSIFISHTTLDYISSDAFENSYSRLETVIITDSFLTTFPFDMLSSCPVLTDIRLFRNSINHMADIHSDSLKYLHMSYNPNLQYSDEAFIDAPALEYLILNDIDLKHVARNAFTDLPPLKYLDLSHNLLQTLYERSLTFDKTLDQLKLDSNQINIVQADSISGLKAGTFLWMQHNYITDLEEEVWQPIFESVNDNPENNLFVFDDNPLTCQCNILWLVQNDTYMDTMALEAYCEDTDQFLEFVDVAFLQENCLRKEYFWFS